MCVGPGDDERQDEDGHDYGADACACAGVVFMVCAPWVTEASSVSCWCEVVHREWVWSKQNSASWLGVNYTMSEGFLQGKESADPRWWRCRPR